MRRQQRLKLAVRTNLQLLVATSVTLRQSSVRSVAHERANKQKAHPCRQLFYAPSMKVV
jgi:hypothetical protein